MDEELKIEDRDSAEVMKGLRISSLEEEEDGPNAEDDNDVIDYEEEDDDDEEFRVPVTLGFVEKAEKPWALLRQLFPSKAGGVPAWLDPINLPSGRSSECDICGEPLQFLLQVYAPISEKEYAFHRSLFVFTCISMTCLLRDQHEQWKHKPEVPSRSVKVFRCQMPRNNDYYSSDPPKYDGSDKASSVGASLCKWCGTWKGDKACGGCRSARYCSGKHQAVHWRSDHKARCRQTAVSSVSLAQSAASSAEMQEVASTSLWPEFEIKIEDECESDVEISQDITVGTVKSSVDICEGDEDKISWATFQQRVEKAPEQVLRYSRDPGGRPLWPMSSGRPSKADIPKCNYCGGDRIFEFQILPQLLYYFNVKNEPDSVDWATIAVYACAESCDASVAYKEEFAWVQLSSQHA